MSTERHTFYNAAGGAFDLSDSAWLSVESRQGFGPPGFELYGYQSPGQRGSTFVSALAAERTITYYALVTPRAGGGPSGLAALEAWLRAAARALNPELGEGALEVQRADGAVRRIGAVGLIDNAAQPVASQFAHKLPIVFRCADPRFYDPTQHITSFTGVGSGSGFLLGGGVATFPFTFHADNATMHRPYTLAYAGDVEEWPVARFAGPMTNPRAILVSGPRAADAGKTVSATIELLDGDVLELDFRPGRRAAWLARAGSVLDVTYTIDDTTQWWSLWPGYPAESVVLLTADAPTVAGDAALCWYDRYLAL